MRSLRCLHEKEVGKVKSFVSQLMQSQEGEIKSRELQNLPVDVPKTETASLLHNTGKITFTQFMYYPIK